MAVVKNAVAIRHVAFEDLGTFEPALRLCGYTLDYCDIGIHSVSQLQRANPDLVFILGGPIGAYEEGKYPFLLEELALIEERLKADRPTFGICLGAQLMARALGCKVYPGPEKEIGFGPIDLSPSGRSSCLKHFEGANLLHWHGDTFDLPSGATRLASTRICDNQAFSYGRNGFAVQFHPEIAGFGFERWLVGHTTELAAEGIEVTDLRNAWLKNADDLIPLSSACVTDWLRHAVNVGDGREKN